MTCLTTTVREGEKWGKNKKLNYVSFWRKK